MKLVVLISFLLLLPLCSSGFGDGHGLEESIPTIMDYPEPGPNPIHDPTKPGYGRPPPPPPKMN
ncbi:unnamed protein product [Arabidopsis thaliana]|uniref:Transmembrane protein n=1 Tax=Arabidopsis thaliana TaxID=3702 RepID=A0A5S9XK32_ARATH|nr:unnamed protein product [Arabidopsis thaliana]